MYSALLEKVIVGLTGGPALERKMREAQTYESFLMVLTESDVPKEIEDAIQAEVSQMNMKDSLAEMERLQAILDTPDALTADDYPVDSVKYHFLKWHIKQLNAEEREKAKAAGKEPPAKMDLEQAKKLRFTSDYGVMKGPTDYTPRPMPKELIYAMGNLKLGEDTLIFNMGAAIDCPSRKMGMCQVCTGGGKCYALKTELYHKDDKGSAIRARRLQGKQWDKFSVEEIARQMTEIIEKHGIKYVRLNESGDFRHQDDVNKASQLADLLKGKAVVYMYTARRDLDYSNISDNLVVNGSGFMVDNEFKFVPAREFGNIQPDDNVCSGNCPTCDWCKVKRGKTVLIKQH